MSDTVTTDYAPYHGAVAHLASVCDRAHTDDGQGFAKSDTWLGHALANTPIDLWDGDAAYAAWEMTRKYKGQLANAGIEWDEMPVPADAAERESQGGHLAARHNAADRIRARREAEARAAAKAAKNWVLCSEEGGEIILAFDPKANGGFDWDMVNEAKAIKGRKYRGEYKGFERVNVYPFTSLEPVVAFCDRHEITVAPEVRAMVGKAIVAAAEAAKVEAVRPTVFAKDGKLIIRKAWDDRTKMMNDALRAYNNGYSTWKNEERQHVVKIREVAPLRALIAEYKLVCAPEATALLDQVEADRAENKALAVAMTADPVEVPGLAADAVPMPHQYVPVRFGTKNRKVIFGDDMGLGKTFSSLMTLAVAGALPAIVVCRPSLTLNWKKEVERFFPTWRVVVLDGFTPYEIPEADVVIIGTAALGNTLVPVKPTKDQVAAFKADPIEKVPVDAAREAARYLVAYYGTARKVANAISTVVVRETPGGGMDAERVTMSEMTVQKILDGTHPVVQRQTEMRLMQAAYTTHVKSQKAPLFPWLRELAKVGAKAVVVDESQDTKEASNRSLAVEKLTAPLRTDADALILLLTGTAIVNRPKELLRQLQILGRADEFDGPGAFLRRYCSGKKRMVQGVMKDDFKGAHHLIELNRLLLERGIMCRRDDSALDLPPLSTPVVVITADQLDRQVMAKYRQAERDVIAHLASEARRIAAELGEDPESAAVKAKMRANAAEHLVEINALRKLVGDAKLGYVFAWVDAQVAAGEKVVIAAHHQPVVSAIAKRYGGLKLQGGQTAAEKEAAKARFQGEPVEDAPAMAVAIDAGGVGHTLHAARKGVLAEWCWTPGGKDQMVKRIHRIGQTREVEFTLLVAEGTVDEMLADMVFRKGRTLRAVLDGKVDDGVDLDEKAGVADVAWKLAQRGLKAA